MARPADRQPEIPAAAPPIGAGEGFSAGASGTGEGAESLTELLTELNPYPSSTRESA